MPRFVSAHIIACMTRQAVERLAKEFMVEESDGVKSVRVQCDTMLGRMVCEWEAPDQYTLIEWLKKRHVHLRAESEWVMRVQIEAVEGKVVKR